MVVRLVCGIWLGSLICSWAVASNNAYSLSRHEYTTWLTEEWNKGDYYFLGSSGELSGADAAWGEESVNLLSQRYDEQFKRSSEHSILLPHWRNYILPLTYNSNPNNQPYDISASNDPSKKLDHDEMKFQLSIKTPLLKSVVFEDDQIFFGMTLTSWWQAFNADSSSPFRETNYSPEIFWITPVDDASNWLDVDYVALGFIHQSNGRSNPFSRSWNRVYLQLFWEHNRWAIMLQPWWRLEEEKKKDRFDAQGDDNPDITKFMGYFETGAIYRDHKNEYGLIFRNNLRSDNKGAIQLEWSYPLLEQLRFYVQYFNGYGESLIDYDASVSRISVGVLLNTLI